MPEEKAVERRELYYSGRVQGVGFRYTTRSLARGLAVTGFVRNLGDGRVEVVVEGAADEIRELLDRIEEHLGHYVRHVEQEKSAATGEFNGFEIRF